MLVYLFFSWLAFSHTPELAEDRTGLPHMAPILVLGDYEESSILETIPTVSKLEGEELLKKRQMSLGETLRNEVGVTATSYGPNASRPVIRGMDGERIRILQNGIGVLDASGASQDHAVPVDMSTVDSIEIVRGPVTLLYGSSAVGGVVNILNSRIHDQYTAGGHSSLDVQGSSVNSGQSYSAKTDYGVANWMFHVDGQFSKSQDLKVPGYVRSEQLRALSPQTPEPRDRIANSASETKSGAAGASYIFEKGHLGLSASTFGTEYGAIAEADVRVDMEQHRFDLAGEWRDLGPFRALRFKTAQSIYKHQEEEAGAVGTVFKNNGNETRVELLRRHGLNHNSMYGLQTNIFTFSALGAEAFLPTTKNLAAALFAFEEHKWDAFKINYGARIESNSSEPEAGGTFTATEKESFTPLSGAMGAGYEFSHHILTTLNVSYNERAPNFQELFSNGAHVASSAFQVGSTALEKEKSIAAEWSLRHKENAFTGTLNIFGQKFREYIELAPTGAFDDTDGSGTAGDSAEDVAIFNNTQRKEAEIYGAELDMDFHMDALDWGRFNFQLKGDYLRGRNSQTGANLARMTPPRLTFAVNHGWRSFIFDVELQQVFEQTKTAPNELPTDEYFQTNLGLRYKIAESSHPILFFARVNNVFDVEARNHVSLLKDITQLGGRNFTGGIKATF